MTQSVIGAVNNARELFQIEDFPGNLFSLLESQRYIERFSLLLFREDISKLSGFIGYGENGLSLICINYKRPIGHQNFTLAHELGHWLLHNGQSISDNLDNILKPVDPAVSLDDDYCLIIAGAGAGKTTTVAAKVKYLVDRQGIKPSQILVVSFTNKAVNELKEKIQSALGIPCPIATFHSAGNAIIHVNAPEEKLNIVSDE